MVSAEHRSSGGPAADHCISPAGAVVSGRVAAEKLHIIFLISDGMSASDLMELFRKLCFFSDS
jgi:hypothetical protein